MFFPDFSHLREILPNPGGAEVLSEHFVVDAPWKAHSSSAVGRRPGFFEDDKFTRNTLMLYMICHTL
jgi:hypothetical protein